MLPSQSSSVHHASSSLLSSLIPYMLPHIHCRATNNNNKCSENLAQWSRHQGLVTMTSVETPPPPQEEIVPENPLTSQ
ncbi:hypothetical protein E3N88_35321 [Mikania micrantha]|uniref:Uncharacterized protein n=1 Tax=Mikania micrantha TaxID=192012 RepID=A0A5N6M147_9ASTR|nr:hypothetical protein E3N88_35321 [Mikania micrantha]